MNDKLGTCLGSKPISKHSPILRHSAGSSLKKTLKTQLQNLLEIQNPYNGWNQAMHVTYMKQWKL